VGWREREKENSGKQRFKIFFFLASACAGKKENNAKTVLFRVVFFLFFLFLFLKRMKTNLGVTQKWVMTVAPRLYNAYEAKKTPRCFA
jgi:hypothetical protein